MQKDISLLDYLRMKSSDLINFITVVTAEILFQNHYSLEYILYNFYNNYKLKYDVLDKMSLIWYDTYTKRISLVKLINNI